MTEEGNDGGGKGSDRSRLAILGAVAAGVPLPEAIGGVTQSSVDRVLGKGRHSVEMAFTKDDGLGGQVVLRRDGEVLGDGAIERFMPSGFNGVGVGLTRGYEWGPAVGEGHEAPFSFTRTILRAEVLATGPVVRDLLVEVAAMRAEQ